MNYKIIVGSSCDLDDELMERINIASVPFKIDVDDKSYIDDGNLNTIELVEDMKNSVEPVRTSCPAPGDFVSLFEEEDNIFVVTISSQLSGTYNSAELAKNMVLEKYPNKFIHIFDSKSASVGETLVALKIQECVDSNMDRDEIVETVDKYINSSQTYFILESLDNLIKNGRISKTKGLIANVLNIKPIMGSDDDGNIQLIENVRGAKRAYKRLIELIGESSLNFKDRVLGISHVNAQEMAIKLKEEIEKLYDFKEIVVLDTWGLSTAYANGGGIVLVF